MILRILLLGFFSVGLLAGIFSPAAAEIVQPGSVCVTLPLKRGPFTFPRYVPGDPKFAKHPRAVVILGSGGGGFYYWEERVSSGLQAAGFEVIGINCADYAKTDYDLDILQADMDTIAQSSLSPYGAHPPPLILAGWSMGAEQAVPAAGGPHPPKGLVGLVLMAPGSRGRYGQRLTDDLNLSPTGPGTFALKDFAHSLGRVRVIQWDASLDPLYSKTWLSSLSAPHKEFVLPYAIHDFNGANADFVKRLADSLNWILSPPEMESKPNGIKAQN